MKYYKDMGWIIRVKDDGWEEIHQDGEWLLYGWWKTINVYYKDKNRPIKRITRAQAMLELL